MNWTPELIVAALTAITAIITAVLHKLKWIKIPIRRNNSNQFSGMSIQQIEDCVHRHEVTDKKIEDMGKVQVRQEVCIENTKDRLNKGEEKFGKFQEDISLIKTNVAVIKETMNQQYGFMTDSMKIILKKIE